MQQTDHSYKEICEQIAKGNLEFYSTYLADDVHWNIIGEETVIGKDKIIKRAGMAELNAYPIIDIKNIIAEGEKVVIVSTGEATLKDGASYNQTYCDVYYFKNGKIVEFTTFLDTALSNNTKEIALKGLVVQINLAFEKGDFEFLRNHMTDNVEWKIIGHKNLVKGKKEFIKVCSAAPLKNRTSKVTVTNIIIENDKAAAEIIIEAETLDGKQYHQTGCDFYHFSGDKFDSLVSYVDTAYDNEILEGKEIYPRMQ